MGADGKVVCNRNKYANEASFQQENVARMTQAKQWAMAFIMFADAHGNQLPKNFEQALNYVPGLWSRIGDCVGRRLQQVCQTGPNHFAQGKRTETVSDGLFFRVYAFMDGHASRLARRRTISRRWRNSAAIWFSRQRIEL